MKKLLLFLTISIVSTNASLSIISCNNTSKDKNSSNGQSEKEGKEDENYEVEQFDLSTLNFDQLVANVSTSEKEIIHKIIEKSTDQIKLNINDLVWTFSTSYDKNKIGKYSLNIKAKLNSKTLKGEKSITLNIYELFDLGNLKSIYVWPKIGQSEAEVRKMIQERFDREVEEYNTAHKAEERIIEINPKELKKEFTKPYVENKLGILTFRISAIDNAKTVENFVDIHVSVEPVITQVAREINRNEHYQSGLSAVIFLKDKSILVGYKGKSDLYHYGSDWRKIEDDPIISFDRKYGSIGCMAELNDGSFLVGTDDGYIIKYDYYNEPGKYKIINFDEGRLPIEVRTIIQSDDETVLISADDRGATASGSTIYSIALNKFSEGRFKKTVSSWTKFTSLAKLQDGTIFVGCEYKDHISGSPVDYGKYRYLNSKGEEIKEKETNGFYRKGINAVLQIENGIILVAVGKSVALLDDVNKKQYASFSMPVDGEYCTILISYDENTIYAVSDIGNVYKIEGGFKK